MVEIWGLDIKHALGELAADVDDLGVESNLVCGRALRENCKCIKRIREPLLGGFVLFYRGCGRCLLRLDITLKFEDEAVYCISRGWRCCRLCGLVYQDH